MLRNGDIVVLRMPFGAEPVNSHGLVFDVYDGGAQIIFAYGEHCGFSNEEQEEWVTRIAGSRIIYPFKNVIQLQHDYDSGTFNWLKRVSDSKLDNDKLNKIVFRKESSVDTILGSCDDA